MKALTTLAATLAITTLAAVASADSSTATSATTTTETPVLTLTREVKNDEKETLLADSFSKTLYVFDVDQNSGTSKCTGDCAEVWPPYILTPGEAAGLKAPLGSVARSNKKLQLTYSGRPVYTYIFDRSAGDDHGDGVGGVWHYLELKK